MITQAPQRFVHADNAHEGECYDWAMTKDWLCACGYRLRSWEHDCHDPVWYCIDCCATMPMTEEEHDCANE